MGREGERKRWGRRGGKRERVREKEMERWRERGSKKVESNFSAYLQSQLPQSSHKCANLGSS